MSRGRCSRTSLPRRAVHARCQAGARRRRPHVGGAPDGQARTKSLQFRSQVKQEQLDEAEGVALLTVKAKEVKGKGGADATIRSSLRPTDAGTRVDLVARRAARSRRPVRQARAGERRRGVDETVRGLPGVVAGGSASGGAGSGGEAGRRPAPAAPVALAAALPAQLAGGLAELDSRQGEHLRDRQSGVFAVLRRELGRAVVGVEGPAARTSNADQRGGTPLRDVPEVRRKREPRWALDEVAAERPEGGCDRSVTWS